MNVKPGDFVTWSLNPPCKKEMRDWRAELGSGPFKVTNVSQPEEQNNHYMIVTIDTKEGQLLFGTMWLAKHITN